MKKIKHYVWPTTHEENDHMLSRQLENRLASKKNLAENWMYEKLKQTPYKWTRQAMWGVRLFDFWSYKIGIAVEVDGKEHDAKRDYGRDMVDYQVSGIKVLRVRNFNELDAKIALKEINRSETWNDRRQKLGLKLIRTYCF
jgi:very-short-patch-repair endonuclease